MRIGILFILAGILLPVASPAALPPLPELRGSILIDGDVGFTASNGVRSGSGSADDPFVIDNWTILQTPGIGLHLNHTRAHVIIEDLTFVSAQGMEKCLTVVFSLGCPFEENSVGIALHDAQNVTVRRVWMQHVDTGVDVRQGANVTLEDVRIQNPLGRIAAMVGIQLNNQSRDVRISRYAPSEVVFPLLLWDVSSLVVEDTTLPPSQGFLIDPPLGGTWINLYGVDNATFRRVHVGGFNADIGWPPRPEARVIDIAIIDSDIRGGFDGSADRIVPYDRITFCGNRFVNTTYHPIYLNARATNVSLIGNRFENNSWPIYIQHGAWLHRNVIARSGIDHGYNWALALASGVTAPHVARENVFLDNPGTIKARDTADLRENWWGDASGPSGIGPGTGGNLQAFPGGQPAFSPWLTSAPELSVTCPS